MSSLLLPLSWVKQWQNSVKVTEGIFDILFISKCYLVTHRGKRCVAHRAGVSQYRCILNHHDTRSTVSLLWFRFESRWRWHLQERDKKKKKSFVYWCTQVEHGWPHWEAAIDPVHSFVLWIRRYRSPCVVWPRSVSHGRPRKPVPMQTHRTLIFAPGHWPMVCGAALLVIDVCVGY